MDVIPNASISYLPDAQYSWPQAASTSPRSGVRWENQSIDQRSSQMQSYHNYQNIAGMESHQMVPQPLLSGMPLQQVGMDRSRSMEDPFSASQRHFRMDGLGSPESRNTSGLPCAGPSCSQAHHWNNRISHSHTTGHERIPRQRTMTSSSRPRPNFQQVYSHPAAWPSTLQSNTYVNGECSGSSVHMGSTKNLSSPPSHSTHESIQQIAHLSTHASMQPLLERSPQYFHQDYSLVPNNHYDNPYFSNVPWTTMTNGRDYQRDAIGMYPMPANQPLPMYGSEMYQPIGNASNCFNMGSPLSQSSDHRLVQSPRESNAMTLMGHNPGAMHTAQSIYHDRGRFVSHMSVRRQQRDIVQTSDADDLSESSCGDVSPFYRSEDSADASHPTRPAGLLIRNTVETNGAEDVARTRPSVEKRRLALVEKLYNMLESDDLQMNGSLQWLQGRGGFRVSNPQLFSE